MTPKEQAQDLWLTYYELLPDGIYSNEYAKSEAKKLALIAVNEIIKELEENYDSLYTSERKQYCYAVKTEIENL